MTRFVIVAAGVALLAWLRYTRRLDDTPKWKPGPHE